MSMKPRGLEPIPEETRRLAHRLSPKGTLVTQVRDALGPIYSDEPFAHLFPTRGRAAEAPWRLALVTVLQAIEGLTDRQHSSEGGAASVPMGLMPPFGWQNSVGCRADVTADQRGRSTYDEIRICD